MSPRVTLAAKVLAPFVVVAALLSGLTWYVLSVVAGNGAQGSLDSQLYHDAKLADGAFLQLENTLLQSLRLMSATNGVTEALDGGDQRSLRNVILPVQANNHLDLVDVVDARGRMLLALRGDEVASRAAQLTDERLGQTPLAQKVLAGQTDAQGDKWSDLVKTSWGYGVYAATPIRSADRVVGAILAGTPLDRALLRMTQAAAVDVAAYEGSGALIGTWKMPTGADPDASLPPDLARRALGAAADPLRRTVMRDRNAYREMLLPLTLRGQPVAVMDVAQRAMVLDVGASRTRLQLAVLIGVIDLLGLGAGIWLSWRIARNAALPAT